jgi:hypothetical protein
MADVFKKRNTPDGINAAESRAIENLPNTGSSIEVESQSGVCRSGNGEDERD